MRRLVLLASANRDLEAIQDYITRESRSVAIGSGFVAVLLRQCQKLAGLPGTLGRGRPEVYPDIRSFAYKGYVIFFRYIDDVFEVVAVLEGHKDVVGHFRDEID